MVTWSRVGLGGLGVPCSPQDPRFAGSNPAEIDGFFQDVKLLSTCPRGTLSWVSWVWDFVKESQFWKNRPLSKIIQHNHVLVNADHTSPLTWLNNCLAQSAEKWIFGQRSGSRPWRSTGCCGWNYYYYYCCYYYYYYWEPENEIDN